MNKNQPRNSGLFMRTEGIGQYLVPKKKKSARFFPSGGTEKSPVYWNDPNFGDDRAKRRAGSDHTAMPPWGKGVRLYKKCVVAVFQKRIIIFLLFGFIAGTELSVNSGKETGMKKMWVFMALMELRRGVGFLARMAPKEGLA
jgi:hypothetical protein